MKFENVVEEEGFKPFKIVVETQEEANLLCALVGATNYEIDRMFGISSFDLYEYLCTKANSDDLPDLFISTKPPQ